MTIFAVATLMAWQQEDIRTAQLNEAFTVGGYSITLEKVEEIAGPNYTSQMATMIVAKDDAIIATLHPEKRFYQVAGMPTTEAGILNGFTRDIYLVLGDPQTDGGYAVRTYIKPFANWIWGGSILMALGGLVSLTDRRLRVAAGAAKKSDTMVAAE